MRSWRHCWQIGSLVNRKVYNFFFGILSYHYVVTNLRNKFSFEIGNDEMLAVKDKKFFNKTPWAFVSGLHEKLFKGIYNFISYFIRCVMLAPTILISNILNMWDSKWVFQRSLLTLSTCLLMLCTSSWVAEPLIKEQNVKRRLWIKLSAAQKYVSIKKEIMFDSHALRWNIQMSGEFTSA